MATIAIHRPYNDMLEQERAQNLELRQEHAEWQARLGNLSKMLREFSQASVDEAGMSKERDYWALRYENNSLRRMLGFPVEDDEADKKAAERQAREDEAALARAGTEALNAATPGDGVQEI
jgi:hypothetical protein